MTTCIRIFCCDFDAELLSAAIFHNIIMIDDNDILWHITNTTFKKNLNQVLHTFDDLVEAAYTFNDSCYILMKSYPPNSINGNKIDPAYSSNDSKYVAIDNIEFSTINLKIQIWMQKFDSFVAHTYQSLLSIMLIL